MRIYASDLRVGDVFDLKELFERKGVTAYRTPTIRAVERGLFKVVEAHDSENLFGDKVRRITSCDTTIAIRHDWLVEMKEW